MRKRKIHWIKREISELTTFIRRQENRMFILRERCKAWVRCQKRIRIANNILKRKLGIPPSVDLEKEANSFPTTEPKIISPEVKEFQKISIWQRIKTILALWIRKLILKLRWRR